MKRNTLSQDCKEEEAIMELDGQGRPFPIRRGAQFVKRSHE